MRNVSPNAAAKLVAHNIRERNLAALKGMQMSGSSLCAETFFNAPPSQLWRINPCKPDRHFNILAEPDPSPNFDGVPVNDARQCCRDRSWQNLSPDG